MLDEAAVDASSRSDPGGVERRPRRGTPRTGRRAVGCWGAGHPRPNLPLLPIREDRPEAEVLPGVPLASASIVSFGEPGAIRGAGTRERQGFAVERPLVQVGALLGAVGHDLVDRPEAGRHDVQETHGRAVPAKSIRSSSLGRAIGIERGFHHLGPGRGERLGRRGEDPVREGRTGPGESRDEDRGAGGWGLRQVPNLGSIRIQPPGGPARISCRARRVPGRSGRARPSPCGASPRAARSPSDPARPSGPRPAAATTPRVEGRSAGHRRPRSPPGSPVGGRVGGGHLRFRRGWARACRPMPQLAPIETSTGWGAGWKFGCTAISSGRRLPSGSRGRLSLSMIWIAVPSISISGRAGIRGHRRRRE